jgi:hypothetical protein
MFLLLLSGHLDFLAPFFIFFLLGVGVALSFVLYKAYQWLQSTTATWQVLGALLLNVVGAAVIMAALAVSEHWIAPAVMVVLLLDSYLLFKALVLLRQPAKANKISGVTIICLTVFTAYVSAKFVEYSIPEPQVQEQGMGEAPIQAKPFKWE